MAIQTTDVTISNLSLLTKREAGGGRYRVTATLSWISGLLYGTDHRIPVDKAAIGLPTAIESMEIMADGNVGYHYKFDPGKDDILLYVPVLRTGTSFDAAASFTSTRDMWPLVNEAGTITGVAIIATKDTSSAADSGTFRMPTLIEVASGDTLTASTLDIVAVGY